MSDSQLFVQNQSTTLAGAGASIGDTSLVLTSLTDIDGVALTIADFGTKGFGTIEPNNGSYEESITFSGITQNGDGTATLTGVKSAMTKAPYTETSGLAKSHSGGVKFVISNTASFYDTLTGKNNDETVSGDWTFSNKSPTVPTELSTETNRAASIGYVNAIAIAGAPVSSTSILGIVKMSTNPASPSSPIAVGDNDTRLPSQDENDALAGTSGTPSSSNKYVTNADTSTTSVVGAVVRANGSGKIDTGFIDESATVVSSLTKSFTAAESLTSKDAVAIVPYSSDGGVTFSAKDISSGAFGTSTAVTRSFTVANNTNRILIVKVNAVNGTNTTPTISSMQYNGVAMTASYNGGYNNNSSAGIFYLLAPAVGTANVTFTISAGSVSNPSYQLSIYSYYNVVQSAPGYAGGTANSDGSWNHTFTAIGSEIVASFFVFGSLGSITNCVFNTQSASGPTFGSVYSATSRKQLKTGTKTVSFSGWGFSGVAGYYSSFELVPVTTASYGVGKTDARADIGTERYSAFVGFVNSNHALSETAPVKIAGVQTTTGLVAGTTYYLSNTPGAIATSAGTNSKTVGIGISTTDLFIKNS